MTPEEMEEVKRRALIMGLQLAGAPQQIIDGVLSGELAVLVQIQVCTKENAHQAVEEFMADEPPASGEIYRAELDVQKEVSRIIDRMKDEQ